MLETFKKKWRRPERRSSNPGPRGVEGYRAYVIGDVHGRLDLLDKLLAEIERDCAQQPAGKVAIVALGDLIDRGADSAGTVERLRTYEAPGTQVICLLGNHEEVLLRVLAGESELIEKWLGFGGSECLQSYGVDPRPLVELSPARALDIIRKAIPTEHVAFLKTFHDTFRFGDYLLVHAGIRPGIELEQQRQADLRWIREPFLLDDRDHGFIVVHGHTISDAVDERDNRIGIDTGAYASGRLTALVIDGRDRRYLDVCDR
jgi:serine/threonine protein phosphatase 1